MQGYATQCKLIMHTNCDRRQLPKFLIFFVETAASLRQGFVTNEFLDLHRLDELKNFATNIFLKFVC